MQKFAHENVMMRLGHNGVVLNNSKPRPGKPARQGTCEPCRVRYRSFALQSALQRTGDLHLIKILTSGIARRICMCGGRLLDSTDVAVSPLRTPTNGLRCP
jgi:hypothetical protein